MLAHIERVIWGFEAGVRYRILKRRAEIEGVLPHGHFLTLQKENRLIGTLLKLHKKVGLGDDESADALYLTTLSVLASESGRGLAKQLVREACPPPSNRRIDYAYIEELNFPSSGAFKASGYEIAGTFHAMTFNRMRPKMCHRVRRLPADQTDWLIGALDNQYHGHALADFDTSVNPSRYWVVMNEGRITAGVQIEEEIWSIVSMPGLDGWFAAKALPKIPGLRRILNPSQIAVLKIGNLFAPEGFEQDFAKLIEHLILVHDKKLALTYLDKRSPVTQRLLSSIKLGLFNSFFETPVTIWARFHDFEPGDVASFKSKPFVISPLDIS